MNFQTWSRENLDFYSKNSNMENWIFFARISKHGKLFKIEYFWRENSSMVIFQNWYFWREISKMLIFEIDNLAQKFKNGKLTFLAQKFKQGKLFKIEYFWRKNSNLLNFQNWHFWRENSNLVIFLKFNIFATKIQKNKRFARDEMRQFESILNTVFVEF